MQMRAEMFNEFRLQKKVFDAIRKILLLRLQVREKENSRRMYINEPPARERDFNLPRPAKPKVLSEASLKKDTNVGGFKIEESSGYLETSAGHLGRYGQTNTTTSGDNHSTKNGKERP